MIVLVACDGLGCPEDPSGPKDLIPAAAGCAAGLPSAAVSPPWELPLLKSPASDEDVVKLPPWSNSEGLSAPELLGGHTAEASLSALQPSSLPIPSPLPGC